MVGGVIRIRNNKNIYKFIHLHIFLGCRKDSLKRHMEKIHIKGNKNKYQGK